MFFVVNYITENPFCNFLITVTGVEKKARYKPANPFRKFVVMHSESYRYDGAYSFCKISLYLSVQDTVKDTMED